MYYNIIILNGLGFIFFESSKIIRYVIALHCRAVVELFGKEFDLSACNV